MMTLAGASSRHVSHRLVVCPWKIYGADLRCRPSGEAGPGSAVAGPPNDSISGEPQHQQMKFIQRTQHRRIWLQEFPQEALASIEDNHRMESVPPSPAGAA